jgi:hypothetical protein
MPYLQTSRPSTLSMSHTQNIRNRIWKPFFPIPPEAEINFCQTPFTFGGHVGFSGSVSFSAIGTSSGPGAPTWSYTVTATVVVNNGHGNTASSNIIVGSGTLSSSVNYYDYAIDITGDFFAQVATDVLWDITEAPYSSTTAPAVFPPITSYRWYEMSTLSATASCSLSVNGTTVTATGVVSSSVPVDYTAVLSASGSITGPNGATHGFGVSLVKVNTRDVHAEAYTHTFYSQNATQWGYSLIAISSTAFYTSSAGAITTSATLDRSINIAGRIRAWNGAYPDGTPNLNVIINGFDASTRTVTLSSGSWSGSDNFVKYSISTTLTQVALGPNTQTSALNDVPLWVSAEIQSSTLLSNGDDYLATRLLFRGWRFNGVNQVYTTSLPVTCSGVNVTFSPFLAMSSYRFFTINLRALTTPPVYGQLEILDYHGNVKLWNVAANSTTTNTQNTIDLCSPGSTGGGPLPTSDGKDNPYPRVNTTNSSNAGSESVDSAYWGVTSAQRIRVIGSLTMLDGNLSNITTDNTFVFSGREYSNERITPAVVSESGTTTNYYSRRFWQLDNDGRTEEESDVWWQRTVGGSTGVTSYSVQLLTITDFKNQVTAVDSGITRHPGYTCTVSVPYPAGATCSVSRPPLRDCYLNGVTGYASWLYGGGILVTPASPSGSTFTYGHQVANGTIVAQTLFDKINGDFIPDLFDPFDINGGIDGALNMASGATLRGIAHGFSLLPTGGVSSSATVDLLLSSDNSNRGTDSTPDTYGRYYTDAPWGLGESAHKIREVTTEIPLLPLHTSKRSKGVFRVLSPLGTCPSIDTAPNQRLCYADIDGSYVRLHFAGGHDGTSFNNVVTGINSAECVQIRYSTTDSDGRLWILCEITGTGSFELYWTEDEGANVTLATTVSATGTNGCMGISPQGKMIIAWVDTSANIKRVVYDPQMNVVRAASVIVASGVASDCTSITWRLGVWYLLYRTATTGITIIKSEDDGKTWT